MVKKPIEMQAETDKSLKSVARGLLTGSLLVINEQTLTTQKLAPYFSAIYNYLRSYEVPEDIVLIIPIDGSVMLQLTNVDFEKVKDLLNKISAATDNILKPEESKKEEKPNGQPS